MNKYIAITILVLLGIAHADPNAGLVAHYPFAGNFDDATGNNGVAINDGATWTTDRNDNANSALSFTANTQIVEVPVSTVNGLVDYTYTFWMKSTQPDKGANCMASWSHPLGQSKEYMFFFQRFVGIASEFNNWSRRQYYLNGDFATGNWQHVAFSRDSVNKKYHIYVDGVLFETLDSANLEDGYALDVTAFILGNHQYGSIRGGYSEFYQYYGSLSDFRIYNRAFTAADAAEVKEAGTGPSPTDDQTCANYLATLAPTVITEVITFPLNTAENEFYHQYDIAFNAFTFDHTCFESQLRLGGNLLDHQVVDNKIVVSFQWKNAVAQGCTQVTPTQQQCQFSLQVYFKGILQHEKLFSSTINTPNLEDLSEQLTLNVVNDEDESLKSFDQTLETQLKFCADLQCSSYTTPSQIVRNTDVYVEFKVNTAGYNQYYPIHQRFTIDELDVAIQNQAAINTWQEQGRIIYHFRPPVASPSAVLAIGISLSQTNPNARRRILSDEQSQQTGADILEQEKDNIGKYIRVQIVDHEGKHVSNKKNDDDSNEAIVIVIAVAAVVLVVSLAGIGVFYKLRKPQAKNISHQQQGQQLEPSSPKSLRSDERLDIQVE